MKAESGNHKEEPNFDLMKLTLNFSCNTQGWGSREDEDD